MATPIYVTQGKLVSDASLVPYIRRQKIMFDADNLKPYKRVSLFFDDIAVDQVTQKANIIEVNARKQIVLTTTGSYTAVTTDIAWQGDKFSTKSFYGNVVSYNSSTKTLVINNMSGLFDKDASVYISNSTGATLKLTATVASHVSQNNASTFSQDEEIYVERTGHYMVVVGTSGENLLYLNENYIYCNVIALSTTLPTSAFEDGDLVFQGKNGKRNFKNATFVGRVKYFRPQASANVISIEPISGKLKQNFDSANARISLYNQSNTSAPVVKILNTRLNNFDSGDNLVSIDTGKKLEVSVRKHYSGVFSNTVLSFSGLTGPSRTILQLSANVDPNWADGRLFRLTSGKGLLQTKRIVEVLNNAIRVNTAIDFGGVNSTTHYSIGPLLVDENGGTAGIFNLPEETFFKFKTGERVLTITDTDTVDNPNYTMKASAKFTASGLLNITQRITSTPVNQPLPEFSAQSPVVPQNPTQDSSNPVFLGTGAVDSIPRVGFVNGLSQTFFTPKSPTKKNDRGIFVTSVDLFFKSKPRRAQGSMQFPVSVRIAAVVNGYPTKNYLAYAKVSCADVNLTTGIIRNFPSVTDNTTKTKFVFKDPVYLEPDSEYAITIGSESPEYEVWIADLGQEVLGANPPRRISEQPYSGSLFKSQNSSTWTPYQNQDLMFVINKAKFGTAGGAVYFKLTKPPEFDMDVARLILHTNDLAFTNAVIDYGVKSYRRNSSTKVASEETNYTELNPHKFLEYGDLADKDSTFTTTRFIKSGRTDSVVVRADIVSADDDISPMINRESISVAVSEYDINNAGLPNTVITIASPGSGYKKEPNGNLVGSSDVTLNTAASTYRTTYYSGNTNVAMYALTFSAPTGSGATGFAVANTDGLNRIDQIIMVTEGSGYYETPKIVVANPLDGAAQNEALVVCRGETGRRGGNIRARYQTRQISLLEGFEAGDLIVFMDAIRPSGTDIQVYYKVLGVDDPEKFFEKTWVRMVRRVDIFSKDSTTIREFEYRPSLTKNELSYIIDGTQYPIGKVFKSFAVKICLTSEDKAVVPYIRNIRISAVPAG